MDKQCILVVFDCACPARTLQLKVHKGHVLKAKQLKDITIDFIGYMFVFTFVIPILPFVLLKLIRH
ncbi:MAG TPA: hypothetical protein VLE74_02570 [Candidatus Saccharimonadales bacterium]|nr:hypothetical protein [Candidatus Saccharimonadales bacterium]